MPTTATKLHFETDIAAPVERVWRTMLDQESYRDWTSVFADGSYYEGSWEQGQRIRFLTPQGDGMVSEIAENRHHAFISIRHLGMIHGGREDTESDAVRAWAPAYENYTFRSVPGGTRVEVDMDITEDFAQMMRDTWPRALARLKVLTEQPAS